MIRATTSIRTSLIALAALGAVSSAIGQTHPLAPQLASNPTARYTLYLDFSGFNYSGGWGGGTPGNVPAYDTDSNPAAFSTAEQQAVKDTYARFANAYAGFNVNITTIDPAISAGQGGSDAVRQAYYDNTQYVQHTILGGSNDWYYAASNFRAGGVSYLGTTQGGYQFSGAHQNWVFPTNGSGTSAKGMAAAGIHEDGHALSLQHQHDENFAPGQTGYEYSKNNGASGNGSYAPIMGTTYVSQRGTWRQGRAGTNANDVSVLESNANIGALADDGIGHSLVTATALAVSANGTVNVNAASSKGFILPKASTNYSAGTGPIAGGDSVNYTTDFYAFSTTGGTLSLTANDGNSLLAAGVADPGATMRCVMNILNANGIVVGTATESLDTLSHTYTGALSAGTYYAQILSYGAYVSAYEPDSRYFNMGGYFLTGSGIQAVPEPTALAALGLAALAVLRRRRRSDLRQEARHSV